MRAKLNTSVIKANTSQDNLNSLMDYVDAVRKLHALVYYHEMEFIRPIDVTVTPVGDTNMYYSPMFNTYFYPDEVEIIPE